MTKLIFFLLLNTFFLLPNAHAKPQDYAKWVNPFIGTGGHGHTFPGATMPFGMVQLSPDTRTDNWDGSSGYHYSDDTIYGFSHTHLNGTGIPDYCDILLMPTTGDFGIFNAVGGGNGPEWYTSQFSHANEKAEPGYYSVKLDKWNIAAELTSTTRVGMHRYTFEQEGMANIVLDLKWRDKRLGSEINNTASPTRIEGFRRSSSWAKDQAVYFVIEFSKPYERDVQQDNISEKADTTDYQRIFRFKVGRGEKILVKVAISHVSIEGARKNLAAELPGWDFDKVRADARVAWNKELSKIEVSGGTPDQTTNFYTALYHTMIQPNVFNDVDGRYKGHDGKIHLLPGYAAVPLAERLSSAPPESSNSARGYAAGFTERRRSRDSNEPPRKSAAFPLGEGRSPNQYTVFSLWDTFRAAHPLYTIIDQKRTVDFINTFIRQYEQGGRLPVWELAANETDCMIGYHSVSVIADAMAKGLTGFDYEKAYAAAKHSAELDHFGLAAYKKRGYISMEDEQESVSKTLEYAYDDWCIAQMAKIMVKRYENFLHSVDKRLQLADPISIYGADYQKYLARSRFFENLFDHETGFMRPKQNGGFVKPFSPSEVTFHFTEGNSWVYSFFVPHDVSRLIELQGGREKFGTKLDELFTTKDKLIGREQPDITGLIGQYAHGNEPSHHISYLYNYAGQPWKTQKLVRQIMDEFYKPEPDGLIGNEDCGQMSAWYILSASGFYEVAPGSPLYAFGTPLFPEVKYNQENGKTFTIRAENVSSNRPYILNAKLNGMPYRKSYIEHQDMMKGGVLTFSMNDTPVKDAFTSFPISGGSAGAVAVPLISGGGRAFVDKTSVTLSTTTANAKIHFTADGSEPTQRSTLYDSPINITTTSTIRAIAVNMGGEKSLPADAIFIKKPNEWTVKIDSKYNRQYTGGGDEGLIDGIRGTVNFASGEWQGYQGQDFVATIDLKNETEIREVGGGFLQVARSWIWMPTHFTFEVSNDGVNFAPVADIRTDINSEDMDSKARDYTQTITPVRTRFVRVHGYNLGKIPSWHPGAGFEAFIFVDEIFIR